MPTANGLSTGNDLVSIERANGWPFRLRPLRFEGNGRVLNWGQGHLSDPDAGMPNCSLWISFQFRQDPTRDRLLMRQVTGLGVRELSSGHPALQELNPEIGSMTINYPNVR